MYVGFCYYEQGRHGFYGDAQTSSKVYCVAIIGAFVWGTVAVSIATQITHYSTILKSCEAREGFALASNEWARTVFRCFLFAFVCISVAMMFLGEVFI